MYEGRLISSDDHVMEPADVWTDRMPRSYGDRVPRVVQEPTADWWVCDGRRILSFGPGTQVGKRFESPDELTPLDRAENVRRGGYDPDARVKDMDQERVDASIHYPSVAIALYHIANNALLTDACRAYNNWLADFCRHAPQRLKGIGIVNAEEAPGAVKELERCAKIGLVGALVPTHLSDGKSYDSTEFEPIWSAAESLRLPLALHVGANRPSHGDQLASTQGTGVRKSFQATYDYWVRTSLGDMIFSGLLEKHPRLKIGSIEHELGWLPYWLQRLDYVYTQKVRRASDHRFKGGAVPSDFFHSNCFVSFQEDGLGIRLRDIIGVETMLWGSDYPHVESTFPKSREILDNILTGCSQDEKHKIVYANAQRIYAMN